MISSKQYEVLTKPLNSTRVAKRSQGGKQLAYLESWDVRAHLIRIFGYGNFDLELLDCQHVTTREYTSSGDKATPMVEPMWFARMQLTVRDPEGHTLCTYTEAAVGSASAPATMLGEAHDNALKTAESDALKRCAINLGTQFGLSLYDNGSTKDVVKGTLVVPEAAEVGADGPDLTGPTNPEAPTPEEAQAALQRGLGAQTMAAQEATA